MAALCRAIHGSRQVGKAVCQTPNRGGRYETGVSCLQTHRTVACLGLGRDFRSDGVKLCGPPIKLGPAQSCEQPDPSSLTDHTTVMAGVELRRLLVKMSAGIWLKHAIILGNTLDS